MGSNITDSKQGSHWKPFLLQNMDKGHAVSRL